MAVEIWLSNGNKDKLQIPVPPEEMGSTYTRNFEDIVLANGNEKTVISGRNQREYSLSSFFPKRQLPGLIKPSKPMTYVKKIESWMNDKKVLLLQVTTTNISRQVTIRSFEWKEVGGAVGDIEYTLELKEYVPVAFTSIKTSTTKKPSKRPAKTDKVKPKTYTVKKGDCLWKIAKKFYGSGSKWPKIYSANKKVIGKNPHRIYPKQKLVIP